MEPKKPKISIVVAIGNGRLYNGGLGKDGNLLWHIPEDLKRFKTLTLGHPVIMGRKTFESIARMLGKPLPGRTNIVVTRDPKWSYEGIFVAHSLEEALLRAREIEGEEIYIGGGAEMYKQALPYVDKLYLTLIDDDKEADAYFPQYENIFTKVLYHEDREHEGLKYKWVDLER